MQELLWGAGILALPLILALPMRLAWQFWVGVGHEVSEYRTVVRQILDSGHQVSAFSQTLDDIARNLRIPPAKQRLIEAEMLHPSHAIPLPFAPRTLDFTAFCHHGTAPGADRFSIHVVHGVSADSTKTLDLESKSIERLMHWQVIHIPKPHRGSREQRKSLTEFSQHIEHFNYVPQAAFLGLFAWLIVHWVFNLDFGC